MPSIRDEHRRDFLLQSSSFSWFFPWASGLGLGGSGTSETAWPVAPACSGGEITEELVGGFDKNPSEK